MVVEVDNEGNEVLVSTLCQTPGESSGRSSCLAMGDTRCTARKGKEMAVPKAKKQKQKQKNTKGPKKGTKESVADKSENQAMKGYWMSYDVWLQKWLMDHPTHDEQIARVFIHTVPTSTRLIHNSSDLAAMESEDNFVFNPSAVTSTLSLPLPGVAGPSRMRVLIAPTPVHAPASRNSQGALNDLLRNTVF